MRGMILVALLASTANAGQPPEVKIKLGHYHNKQRGIGLVIDLTRKEGRIEWDGTKTVIKLDPTAGGSGRTDYIKSIGHVVLQTWNDGTMAVFVKGSEDAIFVVRDADADPL
jgi:hypothetical protein